MKKLLLVFTVLIMSNDFCFADQWISVPHIIQSSPSPQIVVMEAPVVITPKPLVKTIEWVLAPQVNNIVIPEIHRGLFGRQYIVNRNELITTWVYVPVEVWK